MYFVYILRSLKDDKHYVGMTSNLEARLACHNRARVRSTKARVPFKLLYSEAYLTRINARKREKYLKSYRGAHEKMSIVEKL